MWPFAGLSVALESNDEAPQIGLAEVRDTDLKNVCAHRPPPAIVAVIRAIRFYNR